MKTDFTALRHKMVQDQIAKRGVLDPAVLAAMREVPRHLFVPLETLQYSPEQVYGDYPLPIGEGQTISQPYIVALMTQGAQIDSNSKVLEIGTGSGYAAAILSRIAKEVFTIERVHPLVERAKLSLAEAGITNVQVFEGDGSLGLPQFAPYDAIIVTAGAPVVPESFLGQLKVGGRVVIPVGDSLSQQLLRLRKLPDNSYTQEILELVRFVPLIGSQGW